MYTGWNLVVKTLYETYDQDDRTHGRICRGHAGRLVSRRDHFRNESVRVQVSSCNRMKRMERQLPNSFVARFVSTLTHSTSIFTVRIFPSSRIDACIVTRTDVGSAVTHYGKTQLDVYADHERTCTGGARRVYPGGVYHSTPSLFERLDDENIRVSQSLRYYPVPSNL